MRIPVALSHALAHLRISGTPAKRAETVRTARMRAIVSHGCRQLLGPPRAPIVKKPAAPAAAAAPVHAPTAVPEQKKPEVKPPAKSLDEPPFERPSISTVSSLLANLHTPHDTVPHRSFATLWSLSMRRA